MRERRTVERDAKYMAVGAFALLAVAAAVAFVWWYSGASDRRSSPGRVLQARPSQQPLAGG